MDHFVMACEALFVFFLLYYSIEEFIEIKKHKFSYFKSFWNVLDVVVILLGVVCIIFNVYRTIQVNNLLKDLLEKPDAFANFAVLGFWQNQYDNLVAIAVFICWIKVSVMLATDAPYSELWRLDFSSQLKCKTILCCVGWISFFNFLWCAFEYFFLLLLGVQIY